jgi:voltage-gated potassium channel
VEPVEKNQATDSGEKDMEGRHPIRSLFLIDVLGDPYSRPVFAWALATLLLGTLVYHWLEGWNYQDALYFCVITLTTIGYGDFTPKTPIGKVFTIFYVINGIVILLAVFDRIRIVRRQHLEARERQRQEG